MKPSESEESIQLLSTSLLDEHPQIVSELKATAARFKIEFGWHYLLDLVWIISNLAEIPGKKILDAGAGTGILQWYLAEKHALVISVDRSSRADLPFKFRNAFRIEGLRDTDLNPIDRTFQEQKEKISSSNQKRSTIQRSLSLGKIHFEYMKASFSKKGAKGNDAPPEIIIYNQDLDDLNDIADQSIDFIVAVSALEHNPPEKIKDVVMEIMRVIKPGGALLATLTAAKSEDWWHKASSGMCYSENSLREIFNLMPETSSNYQDYDELMQSLRDCSELRDNLARFYFESGNNGMPWGKWNPQYLPVGILKRKPALNKAG